MNTNIINVVARNCQIDIKQVQNTIRMLEKGNTVPFIARYRKDVTKGLKDFEVFEVEKQWNKIKDLINKKEKIIGKIKEQGFLTLELENIINICWDDKGLEDIYLPFKQKKQTKATKAKLMGLEGLAKIIMSQTNQNLENVIEKFCKKNISREEAIIGAKHIISEWVSEKVSIRNKVRNFYKKTAHLEAKLKKGKDEEGEKFKDYFKFNALAVKIPSHRLLAILRGEKEGILSISFSVNKLTIINFMNSETLISRDVSNKIIEEAVNDAYTRLLKPSIENELLTYLKSVADDNSIKVFSSNLEQLLMVPPLGEHNILAIDPGFKTGCKVVCLDKQGNLTHNETIFPHPPKKQFSKSIGKINSLVSAYKIGVIAIGNGTAGRETENLIKKIDFKKPIQVYIVNENGASIYSASKVGREEFPNHDVTVRGAVSIGRRLLDPLAELVKLDPKSVGVGQYQHDVDQTKLKLELDYTVEKCVNKVGINVNTASPHLLKYVAGVGKTLAKNIVEYRKKHGYFKTKEALKQVPRLGDKAFEQAAGFLRIKGANNILDNSAVHPENYNTVKAISVLLSTPVPQLIGNEKLLLTVKQSSLNIGVFAFKDLINNLIKPGLDPRKKIRMFEFDKNIQTIDQLKEGSVLPGLVENITNFGAFVNIGIKEKGLIHLSEIAHEFVSNPHDYLKLNDYVKVKVISVDKLRKRIGLSLKS